MILEVAVPVFIELELEALEEAESAIRDSLTIRQQIESDAWTTFSSRAALGTVLLKRELHFKCRGWWIRRPVGDAFSIPIISK